MKKFKTLLMALFVAIASVAISSCSSDDDNTTKQDPHNEISAEKLHGYMETATVPITIVDYRSQEAYNQGHIPGSIWLMEGDSYNMADQSFAKAVADYVGGTNTYIFLVGDGNANLMMTLAGSVSSYGFGKKYTYTLLGGFNAWAEAYPNEIEK